MRRDLPSRFESRVISADTTLTTHDVSVGGLFVAEASGITVTLPSPQQAIDGAESLLVNNSSGNVAVTCPDGFPNSLDSITLAAGASVLLYCTRVSGQSYRWSSVGATAS
jgi:hypothetical protein